MNPVTEPLLMKGPRARRIWEADSYEVKA
jgi:hypothetical protein